MIYLPVKFRCKSVHFPWRYSPHNPDIHIIAHYGVHIFSGSFFCYCCRSPLCPALRTASESQSSRALPGTYLPSLLPQSLSFSVNTFSLSVLRQGHTLVILGLLSSLRSLLWLSLCHLSPQPMVPSSQILAMSIFLCCSSHFPGCVEFNTLSASLLSDDVPQHHDSYAPHNVPTLYDTLWPVGVDNRLYVMCQLGSGRTKGCCHDLWSGQYAELSP